MSEGQAGAQGAEGGGATSSSGAGSTGRKPLAGSNKTRFRNQHVIPVHTRPQGPAAARPAGTVTVAVVLCIQSGGGASRAVCVKAWGCQTEEEARKKAASNVIY